jgi:hypothetical protein
MDGPYQMYVYYTALDYLQLNWRKWDIYKQCVSDSGITTCSVISTTHYMYLYLTVIVCDAFSLHINQFVVFRNLTSRRMQIIIIMIITIYVKHILGRISENSSKSDIAGSFSKKQHCTIGKRAQIGRHKAMWLIASVPCDYYRVISIWVLNVGAFIFLS